MKNYTIKCVKTGRKWKEMTKGVDFLEDNKKYLLVWELGSFQDWLGGWWSIIRKKPHVFEK